MSDQLSFSPPALALRWALFFALCAARVSDFVFRVAWLCLRVAWGVVYFLFPEAASASNGILHLLDPLPAILRHLLHTHGVLSTEVPCF